MRDYVEFIFSHFSVSFPHIEQEPLGDSPPQEPASGFLLNITPIDIPAIAKTKIRIPKNNSTSLNIFTWSFYWYSPES